MKGAFAIIFAGRVFQVAISFLSLKIVTNYLSKENVAYYFLVLSILNYFGLSLISPAGQYLNRHLHKWHEKKVLVNRLFNHFLYVCLVSTLAIPLIYFASTVLGLMVGVNAIHLSLMIAVAVLFNTLITTIVPTFNMLEHRVAFVLFTSLWLSLSLALSVYLISIYGENILTWFAGQVLSQVIVSVICIYLLLRYTGESFSVAKSLSVITHENFNNVVTFSFPLMISTLLMWVSTDSFRFVLEKTHGLEYLGIFSVGLAIAQRFSYATESIVQQVFYPTYYSRINNDMFQERSKAWLELLYSSMPLYLASTVFTVLFSSILINVFSGPGYESAGMFVVWGAVFHLFRKITAIFALAAHSEMKTKVLVVPYFIGAIFSSVIMYFFGGTSQQMPAIIVTSGSFLMLITMIYKTWGFVELKWCGDTAYRSITRYFKN